MGEWLVPIVPAIDVPLVIEMFRNGTEAGIFWNLCHQASPVLREILLYGGKFPGDQGLFHVSRKHGLLALLIIGRLDTDIIGCFFFDINHSRTDKVEGTSELVR